MKPVSLQELLAGAPALPLLPPAPPEEDDESISPSVRDALDGLRKTSSQTSLRASDIEQLLRKKKKSQPPSSPSPVADPEPPPSKP